MAGRAYCPDFCGYAFIDVMRQLRALLSILTSAGELSYGFGRRDPRRPDIARSRVANLTKEARQVRTQKESRA